MTRSEPSIARHEASPGLDSYELLVELTDHGMPERFEALRARPVGGAEFGIESVPFFVYGVARCDIVHAVAADDVLRFDRVTRRSGHRTLRVAINEESDLEGTHETLHALLSTSGLATEWHAAGLVAVDIPESAREVGLLPTLEGMAAAGVIEFEIDG